MNDVSRADGIAKIAELMKDIRIAMFVTIDEHGRPRSRPMATQDAPFDGTIWFLTDKDAAKLSDIHRDKRVNLAYASTSSESYLSVSGEAEVVDDRAKIREFWSPFLKSWFDGPDDPRIRVLRITAVEAEYWDTPGGKIASLISLVKGAVTGSKDTDHGNNQTVTL